eukprot:1387462-Pleurochrysis_carterae.AAC.1
MGAGTYSGSIRPAGSSNAVPSVGGVAADGAPILPGIPRAADHGHGNADGDTDNDADADTDADNAALPLAPPAPPAPVSAGRHAATYEL